MPFVNENPVEHSFDSTGEAYDACQTLDYIHDGDILIVPSEEVVGVLIEAWPTAVGEQRGEFHQMGEDEDWHEIPTHMADDRSTKDYGWSFQKACEALDRLLMAKADRALEIETRETSKMYRKLLDEKGL